MITCLFWRLGLKVLNEPLFAMSADLSGLHSALDDIRATLPVKRRHDDADEAEEVRRAQWLA